MKTQMKPLLTGLTSLIVAFGFVSNAGANLVLNGGFETGDFSDWIPPSGPNELTGPGDIFNTYYPEWAGFFTHTGIHGWAGGASDHIGTISQTLPTTAGDSYVIDWWYHSSFPNNEMVATFDGNVLFDQTDIPGGPWTEYTFIATASTNSTVVTFGIRNGPWYDGIDDISVNVVSAVPEPSTFVLSSILIGVFGTARLRKWLQRTTEPA